MPSKRARRPNDPNKPKEVRIEWNEDMKLALIEGLRDQHLRPADSGFKQVAWLAVIPLIQAKSTKAGVTVRLEACKSKLSDMKSLYTTWKDLQGASGFGVDQVTGAVTATEEVWERYIKVQLKHCCTKKLYLLSSVTASPQSRLVPPQSSSTRRNSARSFQRVGSDRNSSSDCTRGCC